MYFAPPVLLKRGKDEAICLKICGFKRRVKWRKK